MSPASATDPTGLCPRFTPKTVCAAAEKLTDAKDAIQGASSGLGELKKLLTHVLNSGSGNASAIRRALSTVDQYLDQLELAAEYVASRGVACITNPIDCFIALEHVVIGANLIGLGAFIGIVGCKVGLATGTAPVVCPVAAVTGLAVASTGAVVLGLGIYELHNLGKHGSVEH